MKKILLTGGGTAGHVMPNLALLPHLRDNGFDITYMGAYKGIERTLAEKEGLPYCGIASGKLRRYFDVKNFTDIFRILWGTLEATYHIARLKPDVVFSKGGFVTVPVVVGAWLNRVPVVIHESDMTPGLANKIALRFAKKICTTFEKTLDYLPKDKAVFTGAPIRREILEGNPDRGFEMTSLDREKPTLMLTGGSLGARALNDTLRQALPLLTPDYNVVHLCGKGNVDNALEATEGYVQYDFVAEGLPDLYAMSDLIISRAGSNTITEILALKKPHILIPLPASQSRGDQLINADVFEKAGYSKVIQEDALTHTLLVEAIQGLFSDAQTYVAAMKDGLGANGTLNLLKVLNDVL